MLVCYTHIIHVHIPISLNEMLAKPLCAQIRIYSKHGKTVRVWLCNSILGQPFWMILLELQAYISLIPDTAANSNSH